MNTGSTGSTCISLHPLTVLNALSLPGCCRYEVNENMVNPQKVPDSHLLKALLLPDSTPLDATKWFQVPLRLVRGLILLIRKATFRKLPLCSPHHPLISSITVAGIKYSRPPKESGKMHFPEAFLDGLTTRRLIMDLESRRWQRSKTNLKHKFRTDARLFYVQRASLPKNLLL